MAYAPEDELIKKAVRVLETGRQEDDDDLFGKYVASRMRRLPDIKKDFVKFKVLELIHHYEFSQSAQHIVQPYMLGDQSFNLGSSVPYRFS